MGRDADQEVAVGAEFLPLLHAFGGAPRKKSTRDPNNFRSDPRRKTWRGEESFQHLSEMRNFDTAGARSDAYKHASRVTYVGGDRRPECSLPKLADSGSPHRNARHTVRRKRSRPPAKREGATGRRLGNAQVGSAVAVAAVSGNTFAAADRQVSGAADSKADAALELFQSWSSTEEGKRPHGGTLRGPKNEEVRRIGETGTCLLTPRSYNLIRQGAGTLSDVATSAQRYRADQQRRTYATRSLDSLTYASSRRIDNLIWNGFV